MTDFIRLTHDLTIRTSEISSYEVATERRGLGDGARGSTRLTVMMKSGAQHSVDHAVGGYSSTDVYEIKKTLDRRLGVD